VVASQAEASERLATWKDLLSGTATARSASCHLVRPDIPQHQKRYVQKSQKACRGEDRMSLVEYNSEGMNPVNSTLPKCDCTGFCKKQSLNKQGLKVSCGLAAKPLRHSVRLDFMPLDYVTVTLHDLKYRGRVINCIVKPNELAYEVEFADDKGDLTIRTFRADELELRK
jgi:hypothetical protein